MQIQPKAGLMLGVPQVGPQPMWWYGRNVRFRLGMMETLGLFGPMRDAQGGRLTLPDLGGVYRTAYTTPSTVSGQILFGAVGGIQLVDYDPASLPSTGTRWRQKGVGPVGLVPADDLIPVPSAARVEIPPVWWFSDQDDVVVGCRSNVAGEPCYVWYRDRDVGFVPLANSPTGAVGGGIVNRILVLLGCTSIADPDPARFMTIRWSDRFNFEQWTPTDITISGEIQLEGGSRIVGGGVTGFGVVVWTDRRMAILSETFNIDSVFERRYIDAGRGLLANQAWVESDGQVWWLDENRVLNVFDGGRPRQVLNPLKYATIERISDAQLARGYLVSNPEYSEIIFHYPDDDATECNAQLVYNYAEDAWSIWGLERSAWANRFGVISSLAVNELREVILHDLDTGLPEAYISGPPLVGPNAPVLDYGGVMASGVPVADIDPVDFVFGTSVITTGSASSGSWRSTRLHVNYFQAPADGAVDDFVVQVTGYGEARIENVVLQQDYQVFSEGVMSEDFRVGGKALQISVYGTGVKSVYRFANFEASDAQGGAR